MRLPHNDDIIIIEENIIVLLIKNFLNFKFIFQLKILNIAIVLNHGNINE